MTEGERRCLRIVANERFGIGHDDERLFEFYGDNGSSKDTFNRCHQSGWLFTTHDQIMENSTTKITPAGRRALEEGTGRDG